MTCEQAQEGIALAVYGELPDEERHVLAQHLLICESCRAEYDAVEGLRKAMSLHPQEEPSANLLARARLRLEEALDAVPQGGWLQRVGRRFRLGIVRLSGAPVMASALLVLGLAAGGYGGFKLGAHKLHQQQSRMILNALPIRPAQVAIANGNIENASEKLPSSEPNDSLMIDTAAAQIANVSQILSTPNSNRVEIRFNRLVPESISGSVHDPYMRRLLLLGVVAPQNSMVRDTAVDLIARECAMGGCKEGPDRRALMEALRYDSNPGVRLDALAGLQPYIATDVHVRNAVLDAMLHDADPIVRVQAIELVAPIEADSSVRQVLHTVAEQDENPQIRDVSEQVLEQEPPVQ
ncbi:MAG: anti-sigma factor family protein [Acidobacteriaceae bacterium]